jgi:hypothetical protein
LTYGALHATPSAPMTEDERGALAPEAPSQPPPRPAGTRDDVERSRRAGFSFAASPSEVRVGRYGQNPSWRPKLLNAVQPLPFAQSDAVAQIWYCPGAHAARFPGEQRMEVMGGAR